MLPGKQCAKTFQSLDGEVFTFVIFILIALFPIVNLAFVLNIQDLKKRFSKYHSGKITSNYPYSKNLPYLVRPFHTTEMTFIGINNNTCSQQEKCYSSQACFSVEWCFFTIHRAFIIIIIIYSCCCRSAYAIDHAPTDAGGACKTSSQRTRARTTRDHTILITIQFLLPSLPYQ